MNDFVQTGFMNRNLATLQASDLCAVVVDAGDGHTKIGETRARHKPDVPGSNDRYSHYPMSF